MSQAFVHPKILSRGVSVRRWKKNIWIPLILILHLQVDSLWFCYVSLSARQMYCVVVLKLGRLFSLHVIVLFVVQTMANASPRDDGIEEQSEPRDEVDLVSAAPCIADELAKPSASKEVIQSKKRVRSSSVVTTDASSSSSVFELPDSLKKSPVKQNIVELKEQRETLKEMRRKHTQALKCAQRQEQRLKKKARLMTNNDLMDVFLLRRDDMAKKKSRDPA